MSTIVRRAAASNAMLDFISLEHPVISAHVTARNVQDLPLAHSALVGDTDHSAKFLVEKRV